jgi:hypothetical protein
VSLAFPDWYRGGFPDREKVVQDALAPILSTVDVFDDTGAQIFDGGIPRRPHTCTFLDKDYADMLPIIRLYRGGGAADAGVLADPASVQVAVIADTREESWSLMEYCRMWLLSYARGGTVVRADGSTTLIDSVGELVGPQQVPELNPDKRMVPLTFRVVCRKPRGLPDYEQVREAVVDGLLNGS